MVERDQVEKAVILKASQRGREAMSKIQASQWLSVSGLLLSIAFIVALLFK
jgi:hypothetical protein